MGLDQVFRVLRRRWWAPLACAAVIFGIAWYLVPDPEVAYRARSVIRFEDAAQSLTGGLDRGAQENIRGTEFMVSQIHVIRSRGVVGAVVDREGLRLQASDPPLGALLRDVVIPDPEFAGTLWVSFEPDGFVVRSDTRSVSGTYGAPVEIAGVRFTIAQAVGDREARLEARPRQTEIDAILSRLNASSRDRAAIIDIVYADADPVRAQRVVNAVALEFQAQNTRGVRERAQRRRDFLEEQLQEAEARLAEEQQALSEFRGRTRVEVSQERLRAEQSGLVALSAQREAVETERRVYRDFLARVEQARGAELDRELRTLLAAAGAGSSPLLTQLSSQLGQYQAEREGLLAAGRAATHPEVQRLASLINSTRAEIVNSARMHLSSLDLRLSTLDGREQRAAVAIQSLPDWDAREAHLSQNIASARRVADMLRDEYQRARLSEAVDVGQVEIVDLASFAAAQPASRRKQSLAIALVFGLVLGTGGVLVAEMMNTTIRWRGEMEDLLRLPALGTIPHVASGLSGRAGRKSLSWSGRRGSQPPEKRRGALAATNFHSAAAEAYRALRTNLLFLHSQEKVKTIVVTSSSSGEGKTTTAANLAVAFARQGRRVLLVDCDLRRPRLHTQFGVERDPGLIELLLQKATAERAIRTTGMDRLRFLPRGKFDERAAEMLSGPAMRSFLAAVRDHFDLVILDTSPVLLTADATTMSAMVDGVLLVVRAGQTMRGAARQTLKQLNVVGAEVLGFVLNDPSGVAGRYGEYEYNHEYYEVEV